MPLVFASTVRVDLPAPGEWVEMKAALSRGDVERRKARLMAAQTFNADGKPGRIDPGELYLAASAHTLELAIVAWSFDVPVSAEAIGHLDDASYDLLLAECERLYGKAGIGADERKNSSGSGATPSAKVGGSLRASGGLP